jgi:predicted MFS family arabinose efflux permease
MSLLDAVGDLLRPRRPVLADGPAMTQDPHLLASVSSVAAGPGTAVAAPPAVSAPEPSDLADDEDAEGPSEREASMMLHLSNVSHACNHFQNQMLTMLYPYIMAELGMSYLDLGVMTAIRSVITSLSQGAYGFVTPFVSRCKILGYSNFGIAIGTFLSGIATGLPMLIVARCVSSLGSSAQHPVGYSLLSSYFPKKRGSVIALNTSASNVGTLIATPLATVMLIALGWRQIFYIVAFVSIIMGVVYLMFRDYGNPNRMGSGRARLTQGFTSYGRVLKNRNMLLIALVFMVGAAGAEGGVNNTYFAPHLANDFGYSALVIGILITAINAGQIVGPIIFGRLSDRLSRTAVLQTSLALSVVGTLWVAWMGPNEVILFIGLFLYSCVTSSRGTLTQAIVADTASDEDRDAAFSLYFFLGFLSQPFWLLVTGLLMDNAGFGVAVSRLSISYLVAIVLLFFVKDLRRQPAEAVAAAH